MKDKIFIDTNVLIYAYSDTEPEKKEIALTVLENDYIIISTQVINELIWILNKKFDVAIEQLKILISRFWWKFKVTLVNQVTINKALDIAMRYKYSYWDSLIIASALENECSILYSEDMQHGQVIEDRLKIVNPFRA